MFLLFLLRILIRREWIAVVLLVAIATAFTSQGSDSPATWIVGAFEWMITYFLLTRFGLLALTAGYAVGNSFYRFPITAELSAWYGGIGLAGIVLMLAFAAYAFRTSLGGRPILQSRLLED